MEVMDEFDFRSLTIVNVRAFEKFSRQNEFDKMEYKEWMKLFVEWLDENVE